ncbi:MAG: RNA polymerase sigma factor RpoD/SigA [Nitrospinota bacterium]
MSDETNEFESPEDEPVPESSEVSIGPVTADSLSSYLKEIRNIPVLSREEERALAQEMIKGKKEARDRLIRSNLKYVVSVANKYKGCGLSLLDLINEGNIGLIQAAKRFDPDKGVKFITYAVWWIRQSIMHALAEQSGTVRLPIKQAGKLYKIGEKFQQLKQAHGREPTTAELAKELDQTEEEIDSILRVYRSSLSLDAPISDGDDTRYLDLLESKDMPSVEEDLARSSLAREVNALLKELSPREQAILRMRFGFDGEPMTLEEIGKKIGLSRERIRQIETKAKRRLRARARMKTLHDYLN